jgi:acetolactate decarboxylase
MMRPLLVLACACHAGSGEPAALHAVPEVHVWGTLHAIMADGKLGPNVELAAVVHEPHVYALGALSELRGELLVLDSRAIASYSDGSTARLDDHAATERATLLVAAQVHAWKRIPIATPIAAADLDVRVAALAAGAGIDTSRPFPFLVEGRFVDVSWHVIDGTRLPATATHEQRMSAAVRGTLPTADGTALGFYSTSHAGVFTHMSTRTHVHALIPAAKLAAHCDSIGIAAGSTLLVPD